MFNLTCGGASRGWTSSAHRCFLEIRRSRVSNAREVSVTYPGPVATCFIAVYTYAVPTPTPAVNEPIRKQSCGNYTETVPLLGTALPLRALATLSPTSSACDFSFGGEGRGRYPIFNHPLLTKFRDSAFFPIGKKEINRRNFQISFTKFIFIYIYIFINDFIIIVLAIIMLRIKIKYQRLSMLFSYLLYYIQHSFLFFFL